MALLLLVVGWYGEQLRSLPQTVAELVTTNALLIYRVERLEQTLNSAVHHPATKAPGSGAPSTASACTLGHSDGLGDGNAAGSLDCPQSVPVGFQLDHLRPWQSLREIINARLYDAHRF